MLTSARGEETLTSFFAYNLLVPVAADSAGSSPQEPTGERDWGQQLLRWCQVHFPAPLVQDSLIPCAEGMGVRPSISPLGQIRFERRRRRVGRSETIGSK